MNEYNVYGSQPRQSGAMTAALGGRLPFVQKVYALFMLGILTTVGAGGLLVATPKVTVQVAADATAAIPAGVLAAYNNGLLVIIAFFVAFFVARALWRAPGLNVLAMLGFCAVTGAMITPRIFIATLTEPGTVPMAGALTALTFGTLTIYAFVSGKRFNYLGAGLNMALWGLIIGGLLNGFFFHSPFAHYLLAWVGVVVFGGYVLYDTSVILRDLDDQDYTGGALRLYLDAVNLFLTILSLLSGRRD